MNACFTVSHDDVQPVGFRSSVGSHRVLDAGGQHGPGHRKCVVDSIVRDQFVAESRWWFDRADEEEELQHYIADQILQALVGEAVEVTNAVQEKQAQRAKAAGENVI